MFLCLLPTFAYAQKMKIRYLDDISDLVATSGKGFQLQLGTGISWLRDGDTKYHQYNIPSIVPRYAFNEHFGLQGEISLEINEETTDGQETNSQTEISDFIIGSVY